MSDFHKWLETEAAEEQKDPLLCAISARVIVAIERISDGRIHEALSALKQMESLLPVPHENNIMAAKAAANRGRLVTRHPEDDSFVNAEGWLHGGFAKIRLGKLQGATDGKD
jgi:hypothetical protein